MTKASGGQQQTKSSGLKALRYEDNPNELLTGRSVTWWKEGGVGATTNSCPDAPEGNRRSASVKLSELILLGKKMS